MSQHKHNIITEHYVVCIMTGMHKDTQKERAPTVFLMLFQLIQVHCIKLTTERGGVGGGRRGGGERERERESKRRERGRKNNHNNDVSFPR